MIKILLTFVLIAFTTFFVNAQEFEIFESNGLYGVKNKQTQKTIVQPKYNEVYYMESNSVFIAVIGDNRGIISTEGVEIMPVKEVLEIFPTNHKDFIIFSKKDVFFILNLKTKEQIETTEYEMFNSLNPNSNIISDTLVYRYKNGKLTGLMKFPQQVVIQANYTDIYPMYNYPDNYLLANKKIFQIYNAKNAKFTQQFEVQNYYETFYIDNTLSYLDKNTSFPAKTGNNWNLMKPDGTTFPILNFERIDFSLDNYEGYPLLTKRDGKYGYMNRNGEIIIPCIYENAGWFFDDVAPVQLNGKYGAINYEGKVIIPMVYEYLSDFKGGEATAKGKSNETKIYPDGEPISMYNLYWDKKSNKVGFTWGKKNKIVIAPQFDFAMEFFYGFAPVNCGGKYNPETEFVEGGLWGFINLCGDFIIPCKYKMAKNFSEGLAAVQTDEKWGYIDYTGNLVIPAIYDAASTFSSGKATVKLGEQEYQINEKGNIIDNN